MRPLIQWLQEKNVSTDALTQATSLDKKIVGAIVQGNYTPSPAQRKRIADALGLSVEDISWDHSVPVEHMYGHGPQFGRTP